MVSLLSCQELIRYILTDLEKKIDRLMKQILIPSMAEETNRARRDKRSKEN